MTPNSAPTTLHVSVLIMREGDHWVAQCLEYDIAAQATSLDALKHAFARTFAGQIAVDLHHKRLPLQGIPQAPRRYFDLFEGAHRLAERHLLPLPENMPPTYMLRPVAEDLRIAG